MLGVLPASAQDRRGDQQQGQYKNGNNQGHAEEARRSDRRDRYERRRSWRDNSASANWDNASGLLAARFKNRLRAQNTASMTPP